MPLYSQNPGKKFVFDSWGWAPRNDWIQVPYNGRMLWATPGETFGPNDPVDAAPLFDTAAEAASHYGARPAPAPGVNQSVNAYNASLAGMGIKPEEIPYDTAGQELTARVFMQHGIPLPDYLKAWGVPGYAGDPSKGPKGAAAPPPAAPPPPPPPAGPSPPPANTAGGVAPPAGTARGGVQAAPIDSTPPPATSYSVQSNYNSPQKVAAGAPPQAAPTPQAGQPQAFAATANKPKPPDTSAWNANPYTGSTTATNVGDWQNDPVLLGIKASEDQGLAAAKAGFTNQQKQALIGFGSQALARKYFADDPFVNAISDNVDTGVSTLAQLARKYRTDQHVLNENLNEGNLFYSGARGAQLGELGRQHDFQVADAARQVQDALDQIGAGILGAQSSHDRAIAAAQGDAVGRNTTTTTTSAADWGGNPEWKGTSQGPHTYTGPEGNTWTLPAGMDLGQAYDALFQNAAANAYAPPTVTKTTSRSRVGPKAKARR